MLPPSLLSFRGSAASGHVYLLCNRIQSISDGFRQPKRGETSKETSSPAVIFIRPECIKNRRDPDFPQT